MSKTTQSDDTKTCPFCAEIIKSSAIYCRYCHKDLPKSTTDIVTISHETLVDNQSDLPTIKTFRFSQTGTDQITHKLSASVIDAPFGKKILFFFRDVTIIKISTIFILGIMTVTKNNFHFPNEENLISISTYFGLFLACTFIASIIKNNERLKYISTLTATILALNIGIYYKNIIFSEFLISVIFSFIAAISGVFLSFKIRHEIE